MAMSFHCFSPRFIASYPNVKRNCSQSLIDFRLHEPCQIAQRILPTEITSFERNRIGQAFLDDIHLCSDRNSFEGNRHGNFPGQVRIVKLVGVARRSFGASSTYLPPKLWLFPVVKLRNDILWLPPTLASN